MCDRSFICNKGSEHTKTIKIIIDNKPKAVIAVACERDLTSGIQDMKHIPVLGVFNKRPNGPCVDTLIDIHEIENAINFLTNKK